MNCLLLNEYQIVIPSYIAGNYLSKVCVSLYHVIFTL